MRHGKHAVIGISLMAVLGGLLSALTDVPASASRQRPHTISAVGAENQYANVIAQIGGSYVSVSAVMSNPNTDPHSFEASPSVANLVSKAKLVVQNGLGYDTFMNKIEAASPSASRKVVDVQRLLRLANSTPNPHLWYGPATMPAVAKAIASDLSSLEPARRSFFEANMVRFDRSLRPWLKEIATLKRVAPHFAAATTEPVGDALLRAAGADDKTPWALQADIMNGIDPSPQGVTEEETLFQKHEVKVFLYNRQVTDSLTETFLADAQENHVPVVGLYETMPTPGYTYQSWMFAETRALLRALTAHRSTTRL